MDEVMPRVLFGPIRDDRLLQSVLLRDINGQAVLLDKQYFATRYVGLLL